jgi:hypothetical protein
MWCALVDVCSDHDSLLLTKCCVVLKCDTVRKRLMNRATLGDLSKTLALRLIEIAFAEPQPLRSATNHSREK